MLATANIQLCQLDVKSECMYPSPRDIVSRRTLYVLRNIVQGTHSPNHDFYFRSASRPSSLLLYLWGISLFGRNETTGRWFQDLCIQLRDQHIQITSGEPRAHPTQCGFNLDSHRGSSGPGFSPGFVLYMDERHLRYGRYSPVVASFPGLPPHVHGGYAYDSLLPQHSGSET
jgi:hypothetical protein